MSENPDPQTEGATRGSEVRSGTGQQAAFQRPDTLEEAAGTAEYAETIVDTVREGLLVLDNDLRVLSASRSFYEKFEVSQDSTEGTLLFELGNGEWDIPALRRLLIEILPENESFDDFEVEHDFERIGHRVMLLNARRLDHHQMILLAIEDITERRRGIRDLAASEERFRLLVENAKEYAIFMMNPEGIVTLWSPSAVRILGWSREEAVGKSGVMIFTPEDRRDGAPEREFGRARQAGSALDERWHLRSDGSRFWATGTLVALKSNGEVHGFAKILRDGTRDKRAAEERERLLRAIEMEKENLEQRVEERTRQVRALASTLTMAEQEERRRISQVLHDDLQQRLYGIQMKVMFAREAASGNGDTDTLLTHIGDVESWLARAIELTRRLAVDLSPPVLRGEGLRDTLTWLVTQMQEMHGLTVNLEATTSLTMRDQDMRVLLFQIIRELLFNVVKHADANQATVALGIDEGRLTIQVSDEGQGFDVKEAADRAERAGGFGLFSIRERLNLFDGRISIDSRRGAGTRVKIDIPVDAID